MIGSARSFLRLRRAGALFLLAGWLATPALAGPKSLKVLNRAPLPEGPSPAMDARWASDDSFYLLRARQGTTEIGLDGTWRGIVTPEAHQLNRHGHHQFGLVNSKTHLAVLDWSQVRWRTLQKAAHGSVLFEKRFVGILMDADVQGDRLLVLGNMDRHASDGAVAWLGSLREADNNNLRPVLHDQGGPGAPYFFKCPGSELGKVRFLNDGSFLIVPGFQKGAHLFNAAGREIRAWTSEELGLNTDCSQHDSKVADSFAADQLNWVSWVNGHRVVDDILPLPQGPGLLVRSYKDGKTRWQLKILKPQKIETYEVPLEGERIADRLQGDVRDGRILLLRSAAGNYKSDNPADLRGEIVVLEVPR